MSELTRCNFCTLRDIRKFAADCNQEVTLLPDRYMSEKDAGWPPGKRPKGTEVRVDNVFIAWLWQIPDHCVCSE